MLPFAASRIARGHDVSFVNCGAVNELFATSTTTPLLRHVARSAVSAAGSSPLRSSHDTMNALPLYDLALGTPEPVPTGGGAPAPFRKTAGTLKSTASTFPVAGAEPAVLPLAIAQNTGILRVTRNW